jgi:hypothetical protein
MVEGILERLRMAIDFVRFVTRAEMERLWKSGDAWVWGVNLGLTEM